MGLYVVRHLKKHLTEDNSHLFVMDYCANAREQAKRRILWLNEILSNDPVSEE
jgi:hypothetical protein